MVKAAIDPLIYAALALVVFVGLPLGYSQWGASRGWPPLPKVDDQTYAALMSTATQASAAMLALFFAAISIVASTSYATVTTSVRALIAQDDLNQRYLRLLAHAAAVAIAGVALQALGVPPSPLLALYVLVTTAACLLAFLPLGIRTFALFDPSNLSSYPQRAFTRALAMVTYTARRWLDPSFQNHAYRIADAQLRLLAELTAFGISENRPRQRVVVELAEAVGWIARHYARRKATIPSDSLWFERKGEFKRWEIASSSMTNISLRTGVAPFPDAVPDHGYVEARCTEMTVQCLRHLLAKGAVLDAVNLLLDVNNTATAYAQSFEQSEAVRLVSAVRATVIERLVATDGEWEPRQQIQLVDVLCVAALSPILTTAASLSAVSLEDSLGIEHALLGQRQRALYATRHPRRVIDGAQDLFQRLGFERRAEGAIRTQGWYVRQVIASYYAQVIRDVVLGIVSALDSEFVVPAAALVKAKRALAASVWLQRGIEACHKAQNQIQALDERFTALKRYNQMEASWPMLDAADALAKVESARRRVIRMLAHLVPELAQIQSEPGLPDFLGQARAWLADELVSMMEQKQEKGFPSLFIAYFNATTAIQRHYAALAQEPDKSDYIRAAMDVMLDLMDLSGLALIFTELDGTRFGPMVTAAWDVYLKQAADKPAIVQGWYTAIRVRLTLPVFSPAAMQRQEWGHRLAAAMRERGVAADHGIDPSWQLERRKPHPSAVIESIAVMYGHPMQEPHDYFAALYLVKLEDAKGLEVPNDVRHCMDAMERARERQSEGTDAKA